MNGLSRFQKILLVTDGTVTKLLEHHLDESIKVVKLDEKTEKYHCDLYDVDTELRGSPTLEREILLQGQQTKTNWLYAKSSIFLDHLRKDFLSDLLESNEPIGKLWAKYKLETYKKILVINRNKAGELADYFNIASDDEIVSRTYNVYSNQQIIMIITEKFPVSYFCD